MRSQGPDGQAYQAKDSALDLSLAKLQPLLFIAPVGGHPLGTLWAPRLPLQHPDRDRRGDSPAWSGSVRDLLFLSREGRDLGVAFQAPPGEKQPQQQGWQLHVEWCGPWNLLAEVAWLPAFTESSLHKCLCAGSFMVLWLLSLPWEGIMKTHTQADCFTIL